MNNTKKIPLDKILKILGDPIRLGVIKELLHSKSNEITCGDFNYCVQKATFSHHIKILVEADILNERLEGVRKYLSLNKNIIAQYPQIFEAIKKSSV